MFFLGSLAMTYLLWEHANNWKGQVLLSLCPSFFIYLVIKNIQNYSRIKLNKNILKVNKLFSNKTYDLNEIESWSEETNVYRVRFRKVKIQFPNKHIELIDHADPMGISDLYHYLRTHYDQRIK
jgi:hypothetical protein